MGLVKAILFLVPKMGLDMHPPNIRMSHRLHITHNYVCDYGSYIWKKRFDALPLL